MMPTEPAPAGRPGGHIIGRCRRVRRAAAVGRRYRGDRPWCHPRGRWARTARLCRRRRLAAPVHRVEPRRQRGQAQAMLTGARQGWRPVPPAQEAGVRRKRPFRHSTRLETTCASKPRPSIVRHIVQPHRYSTRVRQMSFGNQSDLSFGNASSFDKPPTLDASFPYR